MRPAVLAARNMRHIHGPPFIAPTGLTHPASDARAGRGDTLMHEPPLLFQHPIDRFAIHEEPVLAAQQHPQPAIPEGGILLDQLP